MRNSAPLGLGIFVVALAFGIIAAFALWAVADFGAIWAAFWGVIVWAIVMLLLWIGWREPQAGPQGVRDLSPGAAENGPISAQGSDAMAAHRARNQGIDGAAVAAASVGATVAAGAGAAASAGMSGASDTSLGSDARSETPEAGAVGSESGSGAGSDAVSSSLAGDGASSDAASGVGDADASAMTTSSLADLDTDSADSADDSASTGPAVGEGLSGNSEISAASSYDDDGDDGSSTTAASSAFGAAAAAAVKEGTPDVAEDGTVNIGSRPEGLDGPRGGTADDLKRIKGVGPAMEKLCNSLGFYHFDQVASWKADEVAWVDANLKGFKGRVTRDDWVEQAQLLASGGETEFSKKVDEGDVY